MAQPAGSFVRIPTKSSTETGKLILGLDESIADSIHAGESC